MKVYVLWENSSEQALAANLVAVLRKIGAMLVYGKVNDAGVMLEDWQSKPKVKLECFAGQAPSPMRALPGPGDGVSYSYEMDYVDGVGYVSGYTVSGGGGGYGGDSTLSFTRQQARDMVRMFVDDKAKTKTKPVVPKPDTTETGVTVRQLDMWEEDNDHHTD